MLKDSLHKLFFDDKGRSTKSMKLAKRNILPLIVALY